VINNERFDKIIAAMKQSNELPSKLNEAISLKDF
jgi:hypothetical protein